MTYVSPDSDSLSLYLGGTVDDDRAGLLLAQAEAMCVSIVSPLPDAATAVVLSAAARAYANPQGVTSETTGPYSVARPWAGVYLTKAERATLRRMAGSGGAFSVDPTPADASARKVWAQVPLDPSDTSTNPPYYGDWDWPPVS